MPTIFNAANYVLSKLGDMSTMKLQKLLYYCQAWSLVWDGAPLFDEDFQAWVNGPVCTELYETHKGDFIVSKDKYQDYAYNFTKEQKTTMNAVIKYYGKKPAFWLSELTHSEDPWKNARTGIPVGERSTVIIEKKEMQKYYESLKNEEEENTSQQR